MEEPKEKQLPQIRIKMSSRRLQILNKVTADFVAVAKGMDLKVLGPARLPPKVVNIRTRLTPSPDGTNLRGNFELRFYENLVEVFSSTEVVEQIISGCNEWDVKIEVVVGVGGCEIANPQQSHLSLDLSLAMVEPSPKEKLLQPIRIIMSSRRWQILNKVTADFVAVAKGMHLKVSGPVLARVPPKVVNIRTRLTPRPDGTGTNLHGNFKLRVYENLVQVFSSTEVVEQIISGRNEWGVKIEVIVVGVGDWRPGQGQVVASFGYI